MIAGAPANENELVAAQVKRLDTALQSNERKRGWLIGAYQAGLLELDELTSVVEKIRVTGWRVPPPLETSPPSKSTAFTSSDRRPCPPFARAV